MRYFFFAYVAKTSAGAQATGNLCFSKDFFPSRDWLTEQITNGNDIGDIAILSWQEFASKEDFYAYSGA